MSPVSEHWTPTPRFLDLQGPLLRIQLLCVGGPRQSFRVFKQTQYIVIILQNCRNQETKLRGFTTQLIPKGGGEGRGADQVLKRFTNIPFYVQNHLLADSVDTVTGRWNISGFLWRHLQAPVHVLLLKTPLQYAIFWLHHRVRRRKAIGHRKFQPGIFYTAWEMNISIIMLVVVFAAEVFVTEVIITVSTLLHNIIVCTMYKNLDIVIILAILQLRAYRCDV